jgi:tRNA A-37 threonylcarbamoyl transferase component Bud32
MNTYSVSHGDTKASNFILKDGELMVLDLDAMKRHKSVGTFSEKFVKDLKRFQKNWKGSKFEKKVDKAVTALQSEFAGS